MLSSCGNFKGYLSAVHLTYLFSGCSPIKILLVYLKLSYACYVSRQFMQYFIFIYCRYTPLKN